jgi:membrane-bound lytic murein transglycosylase D
MIRYILTLSLMSFCMIVRSQYVEPGFARKTSVDNQPVLHKVPALPDSFRLFGERVPLEVWDVRERFDRELLINTYLHGTSLYILKLYTRWIPMIEKKLKENNVPDDFKFLCIAESALQNAISKAGATGFWQFMKGSAPGYGLEVNSEIDERYNVEKSTDAACRYLKDAYDKFGNWTAAAASYNCGMGGYSNAASTQGTNEYYKLLLPEETMRYIFRIMALKHILEHPEQNGYDITAEQRYSPLNTKRIVINYPIANLVTFARANGTDYKTLKLLNPWLRSNKLTNRFRKSYTILLLTDKNESKYAISNGQ